MLPILYEKTLSFFLARFKTVQVHSLMCKIRYYLVGDDSLMCCVLVFKRIYIRYGGMGLRIRIVLEKHPILTEKISQKLRFCLC
jgi:hypothetical protein